MVALEWYGWWISTVVAFCHWLPGLIAYFVTVPLVCLAVVFPFWMIGVVVTSPWIWRYQVVPRYWERKEAELSRRYARTRTG